MLDTHDSFTSILSWTAVFLLSTSYWFQIWKIHVHKEVRDLSMPYHILLATGFGILTFTAWSENSLIFLVKQIATTVPVLIIIFQIIIHKGDHWHDDIDPNCLECGQELELDWYHCAYCGARKSNEQEVKSKKLPAREIERPPEASL